MIEMGSILYRKHETKEKQNKRLKVHQMEMKSIKAKMSKYR